MAADQERNRKIMQAFGLAPFKRYVDDAGPGFYTYEWLPEATETGGGIFDWQRCADDDLPKFPDFSAPEWQIKIQERVAELTLRDGDDRLITRQLKNGITVGHERHGVGFSVQGNTPKEAWEKYLIWLDERKVKHD